MTPSSVPEKQTELTFEWREPRLRQRLRLLLYLGLAFLLHAVCFYVFQVVYPSSTIGLPVPMRVMVLSPDNAAAQDTLREVEDRLAGYGLGPGDRAETVSLDDYNNYQPSFAEYRPKLRDLPRGSVARLPLPGAFDQDALPPLRTGLQTRPPEAASDPIAPVVIFNGELASRKLMDSPELDKLFAKDHGTLATFSIGVNASGVVEYCLPEKDEFRVENLDALLRAMFRFRFDPLPGSGVVWGTATVEW